MIGLTLFSGHVKDKVCDLLAMFGITTTSRTIRNLIHKWSEKRDDILELDKKSFWRFSFDNLNFLRKYANTFKSGGNVIGRMLNLLTGQLIHKAKERSESQAIGSEEVHSLSGLKPGDFLCSQIQTRQKHGKVTCRPCLVLQMTDTANQPVNTILHSLMICKITYPHSLQQNLITVHL